MSELTLFFAGGGTGGHLYPGISVAQAMQERHGNVKCVFLCTQREIDKTILGVTGYEYVQQPIVPPVRSIGGLLKFWKSWRETTDLVSRLLKDRRPAAVLGLGGYAAGVAVKLAGQKGIPAAVLNPDVVPGKANQYLLKYVKAVCCQFEDTRQLISPSHRDKVVVTGCPIRRVFQNIAAGNVAAKEAARAALGLEPGLHTLVVTGASQGSQTVNEGAVAALVKLGVPGGWQILHLAGKDHAGAVRSAYREAGLEKRAMVVDFTPGMEKVWAASDVAISRSGASSCAELMACGVPSILMPYPYHKDMHQRKNAAVLEAAGAAMICDDAMNAQKNAERLVPMLQSLMFDTERRQKMGKAASQLAPKDSAAAVADVLQKLM